MTLHEQYEIGEIVFTRELLINDGGIPDVAPDAVLATPGLRGLVVNHVAADLDLEIYLVRFEGATGDLGPPVGCLPAELTQAKPGPRPPHGNLSQPDFGRWSLAAAVQNPCPPGSHRFGAGCRALVQRYSAVNGRESSGP